MCRFGVVCGWVVVNLLFYGRKRFVIGVVGGGVVILFWLCLIGLFYVFEKNVLVVVSLGVD